MLTVPVRHVDHRVDGNRKIIHKMLGYLSIIGVEINGIIFFSIWKGKCPIARLTFLVEAVTIS